MLVGGTATRLWLLLQLFSYVNATISSFYFCFQTVFVMPAKWRRPFLAIFADYDDFMAADNFCGSKQTLLFETDRSLVKG